MGPDSRADHPPRLHPWRRSRIHLGQRRRHRRRQPVLRPTSIPETRLRCSHRLRRRRNIVRTGGRLAITTPRTPPTAELFEVTDPDSCAPALAHTDLKAARLFRRTDRSAQLDDLVATLADILDDHPDTTLCITGKARSTAAIRRSLKAAGISRPTRAKAYWDEGRTGLDRPALANRGVGPLIRVPLLCRGILMGEGELELR